MFSNQEQIGKHNMFIQRQVLQSTKVSLDILVIILSFYIANLLSSPIFIFTFNANAKVLLIILVTVWIISSYISKFYEEFRSRDFTFEVIAIIKAIYVQTLMALIVLFFMKEDKLSRTFVIFYGSALLVLLITEKYLLRKLLIYLRLKGRNIRHILIVGAGKLGMQFYNFILQNPHFGYKLSGFVDNNTPINNLDGEYLGKIEDLDSILTDEIVDDVIIALPENSETKIDNVINICEQHVTRVKIIPQYFKYVHSKYQLSLFGKFPIIAVRNERINELHWRILKRLFDTIFTIIVMVVIFSWLWPLIAVSIKISSKGPIFYKQKRLGRKAKEFTIYKFRSMNNYCEDVDQNGKFKQASPDDPRVTKVGKILRKFNLDELPQFINVLKGEMSIVGPRPHPLKLNDDVNAYVDKYMLRHLIKPGISGWAQINGFRGETKTFESMQKRIDNDIWYIENWSFWLDIHIIIKTILLTFKGDQNAY